MDMMSYFFLPTLAWFGASTSRSTTEAALVQEEADLESGRLGLPQLGHEAASEPEPAAAEAPDEATVSPDQGAVARIMGLPAPNLQPITTTANQASGVPEWQLPLRTGRWSSTKLKEYMRLSFLIITIAAAVLMNLFYIRRDIEPISKNPSLIVATGSIFISLISGLGLMIHTMMQVMSHGNSLSPSLSKVFLCLSIVSLAFTVVALIVALLPKTYYYMPAVLVPTLPVVGISFYRVRSDDENAISRGDDPHKADRKRSFQLAMSMTTFSFMGALGTLMGYHKNSSNRADHVYVKVGIYLMSGASLTGLLTLLRSRMLRGWRDWKKTAAANAIMVILLVPAVLMVAATFLGAAVAVATAFPVAIAAATWYVMEYHLQCDDDDDNNGGRHQEDELLLKPLYPVALTAMSMSFGSAMAIFAGFLGGEGKKNLKVCVFSVVSCFMSSLSLGLVTFRTPKKASLGEAAKALGFLTLVLLVLAELALVSYAGS